MSCFCHETQTQVSSYTVPFHPTRMPPSTCSLQACLVCPLFFSQAGARACMVVGETRVNTQAWCSSAALKEKRSDVKATWLSEGRVWLHQVSCAVTLTLPPLQICSKSFLLRLQQTTEMQSDRPALPSVPASTQQASHFCSHTTADPGTCQLGTLCLAARFLKQALTKV